MLDEAISQLGVLKCSIGEIRVEPVVHGEKQLPLGGDVGCVEVAEVILLTVLKVVVAKLLGPKPVDVGHQRNHALSQPGARIAPGPGWL